MHTRILFTTLVLVFGLTFSLAQTEKEVKELLPGEWGLIYAESGEERITLEELGVVSLSLEFTADGKAKAYSNGVLDGEMSWSYDEDVNEIKTVEKVNGQEIITYLRIIELHETSLKLFYMEENGLLVFERKHID